VQVPVGAPPAAASAPPTRLRLLEADRELASELDEVRSAAALEASHVEVVELAPGDWEPSGGSAAISGFGLLVLEGLLVRRVRLGNRFGVELLSNGDLLRPWEGDDAVASVAREPQWTVLRAARVAVLDLEFARRISGFPEIAGQLAGRALRRSRWFAVNLAIVQQPKVETRLHMLLWHIADRWGTVRRGGIAIPVMLPHGVLAALVAARRPTVTTALVALERDGILTRTSTGWTLHGSPPGELRNTVS
jgi:CRP-like cAMP-binding protein